MALLRRIVKIGFVNIDGQGFPVCHYCGEDITSYELYDPTEHSKECEYLEMIQRTGLGGMLK